MVCSKNFNKKCKNHIQEGIHVAGGSGGGKFHVLTTFTIHFTLCLIFLRVWPIEDLLFEIRQIDKLHKLYDEFKYIYTIIYIYIHIIYIYIKQCTLLVMLAQETLTETRRCIYMYVCMCVCVYIYIYNIYIIYIVYLSTPHKVLRSRRSKMCITYVIIA